MTLSSLAAMSLRHDGCFLQPSLGCRCEPGVVSAGGVSSQSCGFGEVAASEPAGSPGARLLSDEGCRMPAPERPFLLRGYQANQTPEMQPFSQGARTSSSGLVVNAPFQPTPARVSEANTSTAGLCRALHHVHGTVQSLALEESRIGATSAAFVRCSIAKLRNFYTRSSRCLRHGQLYLVQQHS